jgi:predicted Zn finger-like uncharacterized protein
MNTLLYFLFFGVASCFQYLPIRRNPSIQSSYLKSSSSAHEPTDGANGDNNISVENIVGLANDIPTSTYDFLPKGTGYIMCSTCKTAYLMNESELIKRGLRVRCSLCEKEWFQSIERLMQADEIHAIQRMTDTKISEIQKILAEKNYPKYPKVEKVGVFVGNLPYSYTEKEIGDIFAEYGITNIALVRGPDGLSKGFAFVEVLPFLSIRFLLYPSLNIPFNVLSAPTWRMQSWPLRRCIFSTPTVRGD